MWRAWFVDIQKMLVCWVQEWEIVDIKLRGCWAIVPVVIPVKIVVVNPSFFCRGSRGRYIGSPAG